MIRLKELREARGLTQQQVADAMGIHLTNYNRLENGVTELNLSKMKALAGILHCEPAELIFNPGHIRVVKVQQHVQAGVWAESNVWPEDDWYEVAVPDDEQWRSLSLYGAETRGPSMNKRYPEGSALIYTSMMDTGEKPQIGKRYIIEIERPDGLREATVKTLWRDDSGVYWLLPESTDPRHQAPIALNGSDGDLIRIVGRVIYSVQREV
ncbi:MAG: helix-turn-helix domain-containing protein [Allorhizobium sp.]